MVILNKTPKQIEDEIIQEVRKAAPIPYCWDEFGQVTFVEVVQPLYLVANTANVQCLTWDQSTTRSRTSRRRGSQSRSSAKSGDSGGDGDGDGDGSAASINIIVINPPAPTNPKAERLAELATLATIWALPFTVLAAGFGLIALFLAR